MYKLGTRLLPLLLASSPALSQSVPSIAGGWIDIDSGTKFFDTPEGLCPGGTISYESGNEVLCSNDWRIYGILGFACPPGTRPQSGWFEVPSLGSGYGTDETGTAMVGFPGRSGSCAGTGRKVVAIDPGHGFSCPTKGMAIGAVGVTNFPATDPPAGKLREDDLTMAIAREVQRVLPASKYKVVLTKNNVDECPSFAKRGHVANEAEAKAFVSIHINRALVVPEIDVPLPFAHGTSVLYNVGKSRSFNLAESMARNVSSRLGVNNRGVKADDEIAVLKPTVTDTDIAVLVEAARLSGDDEKKLHAAGSTTRIADGIKAALDEQLGN